MLLLLTTILNKAKLNRTFKIAVKNPKPAVFLDRTNKRASAAASPNQKNIINNSKQRPGTVRHQIWKSSKPRKVFNAHHNIRRLNNINLLK